MTDYNVKALTKPLYNSFFENCESLNDRERREMIQSEESGIDEDINETMTKQILKNITVNQSDKIMNELENRLKFLEIQCSKHTKENEIRDKKW